MVQIEELEGKFAEFDEFVIQLTQRRRGLCCIRVTQGRID